MDIVETGVPGLDVILAGGIPRGALVLVTGPSGAGKTILATQVLFHHARAGRRVLVLTLLTEASSKLIAHLANLAYFDAALLGDQVRILNIQQLLEGQGLDATLTEILRLVIADGIGVLLLESVHSLYALIEDGSAVQNFIFRLGSTMFQVGCTTLLVTDQHPAGGEGSLEGVISDVTLQLEVAVVDKRERRELRVVQERGAPPLTGQHAYAITGAGLRVYPRIESRAVAVRMPEADGRLGWGVAALDRLTGGGIPRHDATLVLGTAGLGKTTLALHFVAAGVARGERCLYLVFHETAGRLLRKAAGFGLPLQAAVAAGDLRFAAIPPAALDVDSVLNQVLDDVAARAVSRVVIDTLNPLERLASREGRFPEVLAALLNLLQAGGATTLITRELTQVVGPGLDLGDAHEAYWTPFDNIVLLRPVELGGAVARLLSVLKMRSSAHSDAFHGFGIGATGLQIGEPLGGLTGLLTGLPRRGDGEAVGR